MSARSMDVVDQLAAFVVDDLDSFIADFEAGESATRRKLRRQVGPRRQADDGGRGIIRRKSCRIGRQARKA